MRGLLAQRPPLGPPGKALGRWPQPQVAAGFYISVGFWLVGVTLGPPRVTGAFTVPSSFGQRENHNHRLGGMQWDLGDFITLLRGVHSFKRRNCLFLEFSIDYFQTMVDPGD